jgi:catalase
VDTQLTRLGGPNFHEIPINAPLAEVHNNQRDGFHRQAINRGRVSYEPNSLGGGCPFQAGPRGFTSFPQPQVGDKVRGKPEKFAEHYLQAQLFWRSQTPVEQAHIVRGFRFELTRVQTPAIRERMVGSLANVDEALARRVADGLGMPVPAALPRALASSPRPEVERSPALSLTARPGDGSIAGRRIAILVESGIDAAGATAAHKGLADQGAVPQFVGQRLGAVAGAEGETIDVDVTFEAAPSVLFDALVVPDGDAAIETLRGVGMAVEFVKDQYRHCKPIMVLGAGAALLAKAGVPSTLHGGAPDPGIVGVKTKRATPPIDAFIAAIAKHRHHEREREPSPV